jgi:multisubunit Na+/H+ antiporter MnhB subunit
MIILLFVIPVAAEVLTPPDLASQLTLTVAMAILYGILAFAISWFKSFKETPQTIKNVITVLLCLLSISTICCAMLLQSQYHLRRQLSEQTAAGRSQPLAE